MGRPAMDMSQGPLPCADYSGAIPRWCDARWHSKWELQNVPCDRLMQIRSPAGSFNAKALAARNTTGPPQSGVISLSRVQSDDRRIADHNHSRRALNSAGHRSCPPAPIRTSQLTVMSFGELAAGFGNGCPAAGYSTAGGRTLNQAGHDSRCIHRIAAIPQMTATGVG